MYQIIFIILSKNNDKEIIIDWQMRESARANMRMIIKRLLREHKYPPEGMDDAVQTVMAQCEMWANNL